MRHIITAISKQQKTHPVTDPNFLSQIFNVRVLQRQSVTSVSGETCLDTF